jgi:hypothetical protein
MNMRRADKTLIVLAVCLLALSCATGCKINAGADVILVTPSARRALSWTRSKRSGASTTTTGRRCATSCRDVHDWIEQSRREFPPAYQQADDAIAAYRAAKTPGIRRA